MCPGNLLGWICRHRGTAGTKCPVGQLNIPCCNFSECMTAKNYKYSSTQVKIMKQTKALRHTATYHEPNRHNLVQHEAFHAQQMAAGIT